MNLFRNSRRRIKRAEVPGLTEIQKFLLKSRWIEHPKTHRTVEPNIATDG